jgi:hypothetical protein
MRLGLCQSRLAASARIPPHTLRPLPNGDSSSVSRMRRSAPATRWPRTSAKTRALVVDSISSCTTPSSWGKWTRCPSRLKTVSYRSAESDSRSAPTKCSQMAPMRGFAFFPLAPSVQRGSDTQAGERATSPQMHSNRGRLRAAGARGVRGVGRLFYLECWKGRRSRNRAAAGAPQRRTKCFRLLPNGGRVTPFPLWRESQLKTAVPTRRTASRSPFWQSGGRSSCSPARLARCLRDVTSPPSLRSGKLLLATSSLSRTCAMCLATMPSSPVGQPRVWVRRRA